MGLQVFTTLELRSELYNYSTVTNNRVLAVLGVSTIWDVPTEYWTFDTASMAVDNGTTIIRPTDISVSDPGRFLFKSNIIRQFGSVFNKEWNGSLTVAGSTAVFDISSASFANILNVQATAFLNAGTALTLPIASISAQSTISITITLLESKTTAVLIGGNVEGLETHSAAGTVVYLTVKGN